MSLPPANKETRKNIHDIATAFGLKSESRGKGNARYMMLIKKSRSRVRINGERLRGL
jgi:predicted RNA-binding protein Jag